MKHKFVRIGAALVLCSLGCDEDANPAATTPPVVAVRSVSDTLAYSFVVAGYSYTDERMVLFTKDTILVRVSVTGFGGGSATLTLLDSLHATIITIPLSGITAQDLTVAGRPSYCSVDFKRWTGIAAVLVTPK